MTGAGGASVGVIRRSVPVAGPAVGVIGRTVVVGVAVCAVVVGVTRRAMVVRVTVRPVMVVMTMSMSMCMSMAVVGSGVIVVRFLPTGSDMIVAGPGPIAMAVLGVAAVPVVRTTVRGVGSVAIVRGSRVAGE